MTESTELVTIPSKETALEAFVSKKGLEPYLQTIREQLDQFLAAPPALDTKKGRDSYASMAFKIARSKTALDNVGKELVADLKEKPKKVDASRKAMRDKLDAWRDEARGPLNAWEAAEEARKAKHEAGIQHIKDCAMGLIGGEPQPYGLLFRELEEKVVIDESWEEYEAEAHRAKADAMTTLKAAFADHQKREAEQAELDRLRQEAVERDRKEYEAKIAREAEERARREADQAAQAEREAVARREQEERDETARKEREYHEGIAKAKREAEEAAQRIQAEHDRKEQVRIAEQKRQEQERLDAERREREEVERRQANKNHRAAMNRAAMQAMIDGGMPEACAKQAVTLIAKGEVPGITINY